MFLGREGERQPEEGPACWLWEQNSQSRGTVLGKKTEEEVAACVGMREGDQRWLILWFGRRSWERWVVCGECSGVWEKRAGLLLVPAAEGKKMRGKKNQGERAGCTVEGIEKKIQGGDVRGRREASGWSALRVERQRWKAEMAVREGSEIGEPWAPAHGCQEEEKSGKIWQNPPSSV